MFQQKKLKDFIGQGMVFPIQLERGKPKITSGFDLIVSNIRMVLGWPYGDRFYLAEFGSRLEELLEEPNDQTLRDLIRLYVIDPIADWEKRVDLLDATIEDLSPTAIQIRITLRIKNSNSEDSFIFPFYRNIAA